VYAAGHVIMQMVTLTCKCHFQYRHGGTYARMHSYRYTYIHTTDVRTHLPVTRMKSISFKLSWFAFHDLLFLDVF